MKPLCLSSLRFSSLSLCSLGLSLGAFAALTLSSCSTGPDPQPGNATAAEQGPAAAADGGAETLLDAPLAMGAVDRIVIHYGPSGDLDAEDVVAVEIRDPATIAHWLATLAQVPAQPERGVRMIRFMPNTPEHRIELCAGDETRMVHRLKGGQLDVAEHPGWAFYSGEDKAFSGLVTGLVPGK